MLVPRALTAAVLLTSLSLSMAAADPKEADPRAVVVSGLAGQMAQITLPRTTSPGNSVRATASTGGWAGVMVVAAEGPPSARPALVAASMSEEFRCGGTCPYTIGEYTQVLSASDVNALPAGTYHVILAGDPGATVTVLLGSPDDEAAALQVTATKEPVSYLAQTLVGQGPAGHETILRTYAELPASGSWGGAAMFAPYVIEPVGAMVVQMCTTAGSTQAITQTVGGSAPCLDHQGEDAFFGPSVAPVADATSGFSPTSDAGVAAFMHGPSDSPFGMGIDLVALGAIRSHLRTILLGVTVD